MKAITKTLCVMSSLILMSCGSGQQKAEEPKETPKVEISVNNNGVFIDHNSYGKGDITLLFVHGWCMNQTYWDNQLESLKADYKIVTMDLPGFGKSGKNRESLSVEAYSKDVNALIDQLGLKNVVLIGHSMGGDVILEAALKNKDVIALVGIDNFKDVGIEPNDAIKAQLAGFLEALKSNFADVASGYAQAALFHVSTDSLVKNRVIHDIKAVDAKAGVSSLEELFKYLPIESGQLSQLKKKLYLINSDATPTNTEGLDNAGIAYEVVKINATGHYPMLEKPQAFNELLSKTIQKIKAEHSHK